MGDPRLRTSAQRVEVANHISVGISGRPETEPDWLPVDLDGVPHERCVVVRTQTSRNRCLDARCDRCWPNLCPTCQGRFKDFCSNGFHYIQRREGFE